jgi:hypothetical protein
MCITVTVRFRQLVNKMEAAEYFATRLVANKPVLKSVTGLHNSGLWE